jgi:hypothetical protein
MGTCKRFGILVEAWGGVFKSGDPVIGESGDLRSPALHPAIAKSIQSGMLGMGTCKCFGILVEAEVRGLLVADTARNRKTGDT